MVGLDEVGQSAHEEDRRREVHARLPAAVPGLCRALLRWHARRRPLFYGLTRRYNGEQLLIAHYERGAIARMSQEEQTFILELTDDSTHESFKGLSGARRRVCAHVLVIANEAPPALWLKKEARPGHALRRASDFPPPVHGPGHTGRAGRSGSSI